MSTVTDMSASRITEKAESMHDTSPAYDFTSRPPPTTSPEPTQEARPHCPECNVPPRDSPCAQLIAVAATIALCIAPPLFVLGLYLNPTGRSSTAHHHATTHRSNRTHEPVQLRRSFVRRNTAFGTNLMLWILVCGMGVAMVVGLGAGFVLRRRGQIRVRERERWGAGAEAQRGFGGERGVVMQAGGC
ncbi:hypothetical protein ST47_g7595 [Ascochyta rabiei]|uniref:Uncharacterized protein n=2 Tax=Didymella rabiei TaxID=5454 RepID=A0A163AP14_DIDRA|nr:hypothetical protein ST47_g7595 [Ascochyta rabiei]